jgi:hypothetical protein
MDLFDDGFFTEASPVKNDSGGTRVLGPDNDDYDPWNPPAGTENLWEGTTHHDWNRRLSLRRMANGCVRSMGRSAAPESAKNVGDSSATSG